MKKIQKILILISCIILIMVFIICLVLIKKNSNNIEINEIDNGNVNLILEKDNNIMIIGINQKEYDKNEIINGDIEENENQNQNEFGAEITSISNNSNVNEKRKIASTISSKVSIEESQPENTTQNNEQEKSAEELTQEIYSLNSNIGTLYIPKTKLNTSVYCNSSVSQMEKMPCFLYTNGGINKKGITLIVGHNRRNWKIFSNNKKIEQGDEFYFTDLEGKKLKYIVYSKFITKENDTAFLNGDFNVPTIALSCCTDASDDNRIIILGKAE